MLRAYCSAPMTYGVRPDARPVRHGINAGQFFVAQRLRAVFGLSSAPSCERNIASRPPAMMPCTSFGRRAESGGHSLASTTPRRPDVRADVEQAPAFAQSFRDGINRNRHLVEYSRYGFSDFAVFLVDESQRLARRDTRQITRRFVDGFSGKMRKISHDYIRIYICSMVSMPSSDRPCLSTRLVKSHSAKREERSGSSLLRTGQAS
jgi:hypothetical protein